MIGTHSASAAQQLQVSSALEIGQKNRPVYKITQIITFVWNFCLPNLHVLMFFTFGAGNMRSAPANLCESGVVENVDRLSTSVYIKNC